MSASHYTHSVGFLSYFPFWFLYLSFFLLKGPLLFFIFIFFKDIIFRAKFPQDQIQDYIILNKSVFLDFLLFLFKRKTMKLALQNSG